MDTECTSCDHYPPCGNEYRHRLRGITFAQADERAYEVRKRDKDFVKDSAAYKRLRAEGLQPRGVNKSAALETMADHKIEVELGRSISRREATAHTRALGRIA